jgi:hypothetical protein
MSDDTVLQVRRFRPADRAAVLELSGRLTIGVAPWRDAAQVSRAVRGWIESSVAAAEVAGHAVFVAAAGANVVGVVTVGERTHFSGDIDG